MEGHQSKVEKKSKRTPHHTRPNRTQYPLTIQANRPEIVNEERKHMQIIESTTKGKMQSNENSLEEI